MIKKILTFHLKPGMYVVDPGLSAVDHPYIYTFEGELESVQDVLEVIKAGFIDVFIDTDKGRFFSNSLATSAPVDDQYVKFLDGGVASRRGDHSFEAVKKNIGEAGKSYKRILNYIKNFTDSLRYSKSIDVHTSKECVEEIVSSVQKDMYAMALVSKLRQFDDYSYTHSLNVSVLSVAFGAYLGFDTPSLQALGLAGLFHDVGKCAVSKEILSKPVHLAPREFKEIKKHPAYGYKMVCACEGVSENVAMACLEHHEKYAGGGYPFGICHPQINIFSSLLSIVDVFDALTSKRPYKGPLYPYKAMSVLFNLRGISFHPLMVDRFVKFLGIYPVGSVVVLGSGKKAIVIEQRNGDLLRPKVRIVLDKDNGLCAAEDIDLLEKDSASDKEYNIVDCIGSEACRINVASYLTM